MLNKFFGRKKDFNNDFDNDFDRVNDLFKQTNDIRCKLDYTLYQVRQLAEQKGYKDIIDVINNNLKLE